MKKILICYLFSILNIFINAQITGFPNPSAIYTEKLGYNYIIKENERGDQIGYSVLPNGDTVESWDFYWGKVGKNYSYCSKYDYNTINKRIKKDGYTLSEAYCIKKMTANSKNNETNTQIPLIEFMKLKGDTLLPENDQNNKDYSRGIKKDKVESMKNNKRYPVSFDWRNYNDHSYIGGIRDQGNCGSCYAFAGVACAEGAYNKATGLVDNNCIRFSEQFIMWCLGNEYDGFFGCDGSDRNDDYMTALTNEGICNRNEFNPEYSTNPPSECTHWNDPVAIFSSWVRIDCNNIDAIKEAIMNYGVVRASMYADGIDGWDDESGIYSDNLTECDGEPCWQSSTNHAVSIVGWGNNSKTGDYWIMRNSWGAGWGEDGYMRISVKSAHIACRIGYFVPNPVYFKSHDDIVEKKMKILNGENVFIISESSINLKPGFKVNNGGHFRASIENLKTKATTAISINDNSVAKFSFDEIGSNQKFYNNLGISIYPNPTLGYIKIVNLPGRSKQYIQLLNSYGTALESLTNNTNECEMDLRKLHRGIYFIRILINEKVYITKIIKH